MRSRLRILSSVFALAAIGLVSMSFPSAGADAPPPFNVTVTPTPFANANRASATYNSQQYQNSQWQGVVCTYDQSALSSAPSTTFTIQGYDAATQSYYDLQTSGAITVNATPASVMIAPGVDATGSPSGMTASALHLPGYWRVSMTVTGSGSGSTGILGCTYLK